MNSDPIQYVALDILEEYCDIQNLKTIKLDQRQIMELFRQIFEIIDKDFKDAVLAMNNIKYDLIFHNVPEVPRHCIAEIHEVALTVMLRLYQKLFEHKLINNFVPVDGFPFFLEHITSNTVYLRLLPSHAIVPY